MEVEQAHSISSTRKHHDRKTSAHSCDCDSGADRTTSSRGDVVMARRNANGKGTIYKHKNGRWVGSISRSTVSGKRRRVYVYGATRQEAHRKLTAAKNQENEGIPLPDHQWRLGEYLDYWLENVVKPNRRPKTY